MGNISDLPARAARRWPDAVGLIDTTAGSDFTWSNLDSLVNGQARRFAAEGVEPGDRVILRLPTSAGFVIALFALARAGAIAVPLSPTVPERELETVREQSGAKFVVTRNSLGEPEAGEPVEPIGDGEDTALLAYTSGTTGPVRGVMLSHRALLANVEQLGSVQPPPLTEEDRVLIAIPLFHVYGLGPGLLQSVSVGATVVLAERFQAREALEITARHRVTVIGGVPAMYTELAALPEEEVRKGLESVRLLSSGAAPLHPKILAAVGEKTGLGVYEGYGLTEAAPVVTSTLVTGHPKPGSVGRPLPGVEIRLVGPDGVAERVPLDPDDLADAFDDDGGTGLVAVRGPNLFSGYWPDGAHGPAEDGWFRTGDVGYIDTDGDLHLVDRANDLIIVNGFNVYPHEVEKVISEMPGVREAAVVGVIDERSGEAVKAVVVPEPGAAAPSAEEVAAHCARMLAGYKVPKTVEFADSLPHSVTGKLRRVGLRS
ncbi:AMP-binding protein [Amycolatopsis pigmentata]|uniref:AMP-binding protein n=1 Tax=Amycolatopsis pigmentata TaxID=450801 RepID=A0ABW5FUB2_9PSEU